MIADRPSINTLPSQKRKFGLCLDKLGAVCEKVRVTGRPVAVACNRLEVILPDDDTKNLKPKQRENWLLPIFIFMLFLLLHIRIVVWQGTHSTGIRLRLRLQLFAAVVDKQ